MRVFFLFTVILILFYLLGIEWKCNKIDLMNQEFTVRLRGVSILAIVWAHAGGKLGISGIQLIAGVGVSVFLICSGFGLQKSYEKNGFNSFFSKRLLKVCLPFWVIE